MFITSNATTKTSCRTVKWLFHSIFVKAIEYIKSEGVDIIYDILIRPALAVSIFCVILFIEELLRETLS
ncbi:hypothetical protein HW45_28605 [Vibrio sp. ER1A]|nr:hypothetical protein HW45_28605 [Vibrio sp. ER1A]